MNKEITIMSVDDEEINLLLLEELGSELGLTIKGFTDPKESLEYAKNNVVDIALIDYMMPDMNGIDLVKRIREFHPEIPVVMITAVTDDNDLTVEAIKAGATEFLNKPLRGAEFIARLSNLVELRNFQILMKDRAKLLKREVDKATKEIVSREIETLEVLSLAAEYKDPETAEHIDRVAHYSRMLGKVLGESEESSQILFYAAPLHDVGKMGIPDSILLKPGKLYDEEWITMKLHSEIGYNIMKGKKSKYLQAGAVIALNHHEKFDGSGYPNRLKGRDIPLYGRIVALSDMFDALNSKRPYKEPWHFNKSVEFLQSVRGKHLDPEIVDAFIDNIDIVLDIYNTIKGDSES